MHHGPIDQFTRAGLRFPVNDAGPADGIPVVLLHGWPQDARAWDLVVPLLHDHGYRTLVPTLRGAVTSALPRSRWGYRKRVIRDDVLALLDLVGQPVHLVGHDWGAAVAWGLACREPARLRSLTAVSVPHSGAFVRSLATSRQLLASWYMAAFQLPVLPERLLGDIDRATRLLVDAGQDPMLAARDAARMQDPALLRGGLNWYRSLPGDLAERRGRTSVGVLQVWGDRDPAVTRRAIDGARRHATGAYELSVLHGVGHWVPESAPDDLVEGMLRLFARSGSGDRVRS